MCSCQRTRRIVIAQGLTPERAASVNRQQVVVPQNPGWEDPRLGNGGRDWSRTSDPALIKRML